MSDKIDQIEGQVRDKVDTTVHQARQAFDLRHQVNERPWVAVGAALTLGFVAGSMGGDDHEPRYPAHTGEPMRYYEQDDRRQAERRHEYGGYGRSSDHETRRQIAGTVSQIADPMREELSTMAVAAVRSAMRVLRESLQDSIPQFDKEYRAVQHEREDSPQEPAGAQQRDRAVGGGGANDWPSESGYRTRQG